jgi:UDP-galactopyranose mutase
MLASYQRLAQEQKGVTFAGRLGTYKYIDMDVAIAEAMTTAKQLIKQWQ